MELKLCRFLHMAYIHTSVEFFDILIVFLRSIIFKSVSF